MLQGRWVPTSIGRGRVAIPPPSGKVDRYRRAIEPTLPTSSAFTSRAMVTITVAFVAKPICRRRNEDRARQMPLPFLLVTSVVAKSLDPVALITSTSLIYPSPSTLESHTPSPGGCVFDPRGREGVH